MTHVAFLVHTMLSLSWLRQQEQAQVWHKPDLCVDTTIRVDRTDRCVRLSHLRLSHLNLHLEPAAHTLYGKVTV
jgi:hypothetical protein